MMDVHHDVSGALFLKYGRQTGGPRMRKLVLWLALAAGIGAMSDATAATCPSVPGTNLGDKIFTVSTSPDSSCLTFGTGNINGNNDAVNNFTTFNGSKFVTLDNTDENNNTKEGALTNSQFSGAQGSFSIDLNKTQGYTDLVLALKAGNNGGGPTWAAFLISSLVGTWSIQELTDNGCKKELICLKGKDISHAILYGQEVTHTPPIDPVPLPPALILFASALAGLTILGRRRGSS
jgi:hypothetical protein